MKLWQELHILTIVNNHSLKINENEVTYLSSTGLPGKKEKGAPKQMKGRQSLQPVYLHVVLCGLVTLNYHIQFHGLFYEKLLFSLSWIAVKGIVET